MWTTTETVWPTGCRGAVSLTFDDGTDCQLRRAVPALEQRGLLGTFYVPMRAPDYRTEYAPWVAVAGRGHEIGNHTCRHVCSRNFSSDPAAKGLEGSTLAEVEADILAAEEHLRELVPAQAQRTFAYPCYQTHVGEGVGRQSYVPVVARHFVAGRAGGEYGFFNNPLHIDLACAVGTPCERLSCAEMIGLVELAVRRGHWAMLVFHQVGGGRLGVSEFDFLALLDHLAEYRDRIWTAPAVTVAAAVAAYQRRVKGRDALSAADRE